MEEIPEKKLHLCEWPESDRLKKSLAADPPRLEHCYTMPGIKAASVFEDAVATVSAQLLNTTLSRPAAWSNVDGLKQLIAAGHLRAAANLTGNILTGLHQGVGMAGQPSRNTCQSFEIWACRLQLLMALKSYTLLNDELLPFEELDAPDLYFQYYPSVFGNRTGTLVPFSLRLVHAEALRFTPYPWAAIKRIALLEQNVRAVIGTISSREDSEEAIKDWEERLVVVEKCRARTLFFLKEYSISMSIYNRIFLNLPTTEERIDTKLMMMRLAVTVGDEKKMERCLQAATSGCAVDDLLLHRSLKSVFYGDYTQALDTLQSAEKSREDNPKVCSNAAVCMLYEGRVDDSLSALREYNGPPNEPTCINFITVAELATCDVVQQKLALFKKNVDRFPDFFDPSVLKLPSAL